MTGAASTLVISPTWPYLSSSFFAWRRATVRAAQPQSPAAQAVQSGYQVLIHPAAQDLLDNIHRLLVCIAQSVHNFDSLPSFFSISLISGPPP